MSSFGGKELDIPSLTVTWIETSYSFGNSTDTGMVPTSNGAHFSSGTLFLSVVVWTVFNLVFQKIHILRLPPQASALEFLLQVYVLRRSPAAALHALVKRYGPVMRFKLAWWRQDVVVLSSVAAVEEFYKLHDAEFGARPASMGRPSLSNAVDSFVFPFLNAYWHHLQVMLDMTTKDKDSGIEWALQALHQYPEVEHHIRSELHRTKAASPPAKLPYLQAVVKELFRLQTPCPVSFPHESADQWCTLLGLAVRPRTQVVVNIHAVQRDPAVWANPEDFDPARFMATPEIEMHQMKEEFQMVPFGGGIRRCPAAQMALEHVQVGLARYYLRR